MTADGGDSANGDPLTHGDITHAVIGAFYYVYNRLGFGFLERVYLLAMRHVLVRAGHSVVIEAPLPVHFEGVRLANYKADMLVDGAVLVELKATEHLAPHAHRQLLNYLTAAGLEVGLLLHVSPQAPVIHRRRSAKRSIRLDPHLPQNPQTE